MISIILKIVKISAKGDVIGFIISPATADIFLLTLIISPGKRIGLLSIESPCFLFNLNF